MKNNKIVPIIITILTVLYLLVAPLLYQNYVNRGIDTTVCGVSLASLGFTLFFVAFLSWATSDKIMKE